MTRLDRGIAHPSVRHKHKSEAPPKRGYREADAGYCFRRRAQSKRCARKEDANKNNKLLRTIDSLGWRVVKFFDGLA
jgi:hypothetical protein